MAAATPLKTRSTYPACDWRKFFDSVGELIRLQLDAEGVAAELRPVYVSEFPKTREGQPDTSFDIILWEVARSEMAPTSNSGTRVPMGISLRETQPHPEKKGWQLETWAWWELMTAQFNIISKFSSRANDLTSWLHRTLMIGAHGHKFFFSRGVHYFAFRERLSDSKLEISGQELYVRSLRYDVRLEILVPYEAKTIETLVFGVKDGLEGGAASPEASVFEMSADSDTIYTRF